MKLDVTDLRYMSSAEFRVLTVEMGSKNHEVVPTALIAQISGNRSGGVNKILGSLARMNLIAKVQNSKYDGYRLTYGGYDYLAIRTLSKRDSMVSVGNQIGVGKESDIYVVADANGSELVLKLHRLGRISFRAIKQKRDYMGKRKHASWMYMSRLAAQKEWAFMKVLHEHGFPVPKPVDQARHCVLMELIDAYPLRQVSELPSPGKLYSQLMDIIVRLAQAGLIHGDYNEFNILICRDSGDPVVIDFPQMVSTSHENAEWYFNRDVECIRSFFRRKFQYESVLYPKFKSTLSEGKEQENGEGFRLDVVVEASGFKKKEMEILEDYMKIKDDDGNDEGGAELEAEEDEQEAGDADGDEEEDEDEDEDEEENELDHEDEGSSSRQPEPEHDNAEEENLEESFKRLGISTSADASSDRHASDSDSDDGMGQVSPVSERSRPLSRSPPKSRSPSPETMEKMYAAAQRHGIVTSEVSRQRARQQRKYHSKRATQRSGRPRGSKAKQDTRINLNRGGIWE